MSTPPVDGSLARGDSPFDDRGRERNKLARKWAYLLSQTSYLPWSHQELEQRLAVFVGQLVDLVITEPFNPEPATEIGIRLVEWRCTDPASLRLTATVLSKGLLALEELRHVAELADRVVAVLVALAAGFTEQMREFVIGQQESMSRALRRVVETVEADLRDSEARFDRVSTCSPSGIAITDLTGRFLRTNAALRRILGHQADDLEGHSLFDVLPAERAEQIRAIYVNLLSGQATAPRQLLRLLREDGGVATVSLAISPLHGEERASSQAVVLVEDISELTLLQDELLRQALHDLLTGLPNRQFFTSRLEEVLHRADAATGVTLYLLDLDSFSLIAAGFGRRVSERLLIHVADRLKSVMDGESAMIARFEGDEFAILVENKASTPDVARIAERINSELAAPIYLDGHSLAISASIGIVEAPPAGLGPVELLGAAETALRRAQRGRGRRWERFDVEAAARDRESFQLAAGMAGAWETGELRVGYQPLVRLADGSLAGVEALLRWHRPGTGILDHERCVSLSEQTGLTLPLGTWRLHSACEQWRDAGWDLPLYLGLTADQAANPDLLSAVARTLADNDLDPALLRIGMPTPALVAGGAPVRNLNLLAEAGVGTVAVDFGAVPADLVDFEKLPVQAVHLARWRPHGAGPAADAVLTALIAAVHAAGVLVIVDDIQNLAQLAWWQRVGADIGQGGLFAPVSAPEAIGALLGEADR
ncbi:MAG TPA: EAL domain-containing protein [Pseudonocardiaceae bacterium]|jgi:diguanylate cyclase (GGDEF)-like protein/PAS domain S-box-containing protein|nr:EAL domain-containing protein [Pseudonocardiaceae bacterium]